jgi:hypothetical protein
MGTHARGRFAQVILGGVMRAVTQKATCPVLIVAHPVVAPASQAESQNAGITGN